jgi:ribosome-binding factor A
MKNKRVYQVEEVVRRAVAAQIPIEIPDLAPNVTVTRMDVSPDLRHATAWIGVVGKIDGDKAIQRLHGMVGAFQMAIAKALATKFTPRLHFKLDTNAQYASDIDQLLKQT